MKYYTFQVDWTDPNEGTDPSTIINTGDVRFEPTFQVGEEPNAIHYAYLLSGEIDTSALMPWVVTEVTAEDTLLAAQGKIAESYMTEGKVYFPTGDFSVGV